MKVRIVGLALLGIAAGGIASALTGDNSPVALFLALLAVPSAVVGLPLLVVGPGLFAAGAGPHPRRRSRGKRRS